MPHPVYQPILCCYPHCDLALTSASKDVIYGVNERFICNHSFVIRNLLQVGRASCPSLGKWEDRPLVVPYSKRDIELILDYCFEPTPPENSFSTLCRLLQLAKELGMREIHGKAVAAARSHKEFPTTDHVGVMKLATTYYVEEWFTIAFAQLMRMPLERLDKSSLQTLGGDLLLHLIRERKNMEMASALILVRMQDFTQARDCEADGFHCKQQWLRFWSDVVAPMVMEEAGGIFWNELVERFRRRRRGGCRSCCRSNWDQFILTLMSEDMSIDSQIQSRSSNVWDTVVCEGNRRR